MICNGRSLQSENSFFVTKCMCNFGNVQPIPARNHHLNSTPIRRQRLMGYLTRQLNTKFEILSKDMWIIFSWIIYRNISKIVVLYHMHLHVPLGTKAISTNQYCKCLLNRSFRRISNKTSRPRVTGLCAGNSPVTGEFSAQTASNAEDVSIWWRHHGVLSYNTTALKPCAAEDKV